MIIVDIHQFEKIMKTNTGTELMQFMDKIYNAFDQLCEEYGLYKIQTAGSNYMACGGLKSAEKKIDSRLLNKHHSVRVTDCAMAIINYAKTVFLKNGKNLEVKVAVHTGPVISSVLGEIKPQFCLIGKTVNQGIRMCSNTTPNLLTVSKETHHYLELYTNNYIFKMIRLASGN